MKLNISLLGAFVGCVASVLAADRTADGYGFIEGYAGTPVDAAKALPFRYVASAVTGGTLGGASSHAIDRSLPNTWAPEAIYQLERWGASLTTTFTGLVPGATYKVELHLTENYFGGSNGGNGTGMRIWKVSFNGVVAETDIDIYREAGGPWKALCKQYETTADANGRIAVLMQQTKDNGHFSGIAVFGKVAPSAPVCSGRVVDGTSDLAFTWDAATDVNRYYVQKAPDSTGPWTDVAETRPETRAATFPSAYDPSVKTCYRVVASNGVGMAASSVITFQAADGTPLKTRGETVASAASAFYRITAEGAASDPDNALAADAVTALGYTLDIPGASTLLLGAGQTFTVGTLGTGDGGAALTVAGAGTVAPKGGSLNLASDGLLRVETAVAGADSDALAKNGAGTAVLAGGLTGFARAAIYGGVLAVGNASDATLGPALSGRGAFEKRGAGMLTVAKASPDLAGDVVVKEGTLRFGVTGSAFGNVSGRLVVEDGAALDVATDGLANETVNLGARTVVVAGAGPDGRGAIVNTSGKSQFNALRNGALAGDVVFGGGGGTKSESVGRWDFRSGALAMNGHSIEKVGSNLVCLTGIALTTGDRPVTIDVKEGYWSSETSTTYTQGPANTLRIHDGALLDLYQMSNPLNWTFDLLGGSSVQFRSGNDSQNRITGPVALGAGDVNIFAKADVHGSVYGDITGPGRLRSVSGPAGRVSLYGTNSYAGGTYVSGGDLYVAHKDALPGYADPGKVEVSNATLILGLDSGSWTAADANALVSRGQIPSNAQLGVSLKSGERTWTDDLLFAQGGFSKYDAGTLTLQGRLEVPRAILAMAGSLVLDGANEHRTMYVVQHHASKLVLTNGAALKLSTVNDQNTQIGANARELAELHVRPGCFLGGTNDCAVNSATAGILVGTSASGMGLVTVADGATVKHKVNLGVNSGEAQGAVHQFGGFVENQGGAANDIRVGDAGYGYYELNAGELDWWGYGTLGGPNGKAMGVMVVHGGLFKYIPKITAGRLGLSRGGSAAFYMDGGLVDFRAPGAMLALGENDNNGTGSGSQVTFTVDGGEVLFGNQTTWFGNRRDCQAVINLRNGGLLQCGTLAANCNYFETNRETVVALLNFDGGVFRATSNNNLFPSDAVRHADAVTLYAGGAVFDASNFTLTVNHALTAASGQGVASISIPDALKNASNYIGAPFVKITGGGGCGATAVCTYDSRTRKVTGVKITNPGTGYTGAPTVTITGGGFTNVYSGTATLAANATTGGVTVRSATGTGTVVFSGSNAFNGPVTVESGRLRVAAPGAFPEGNDLVLAGGTFDGSGQTVTAGVVRVTSGALCNVTLVCDRIEKTGDGELVLDGARLVERNGSALAGSIVLADRLAERPGLYETVLSGNGNWTAETTGGVIQLTTAKANTTSGWSDDTTAVYKGFIWNRGDAPVRWTFMESFDDLTRLWIDGEVVLADGNWNLAAKKTVELAPGAHRFELRLGQGGGGAGPSSACTNTLDGVRPEFGFAIDFQGRDELRASNYTLPVDPGDGSLFTTTAGAVSFNNPAPAGATTLGGAFAFTGTWTVDMDDVLAGRPLTVTDAPLDLTGVTAVAFAHAADLPKRGIHVLADSEKGFAGDVGTLSANLSGLPAGPWRLNVSGTKLRLVYPGGTTFYLR